MFINTDLSADTLARNLQQKRSENAGASNPSSAGTPVESAAGQMDPLLQRMAETPFPVQDGDLEVQDEAGATQVMNSLLQNMRGQTGTAMAAQANQLSGNVLSLLQSTG